MKTSESDKNMWFRKMFSCAVVTAVLFLGAYLWDTKISRPATSAATTKNVSTTLPEKSKYKHTRIADIKVGERVVTSSDDAAKPTAVDPVTWKKVTLYAEETWYDGTLDSINVVTLVPPEWLALYDAKVGSKVPIPLDLQEMGLDENLLAKIQAIEECPEIRAGPGRVVLTTVNHLSRGVCSLTYTTQDGKSETIRPTSSHRFYSLDRKEWIHIGDARTGEKLQGLGSGIIEVVSCQPLGTTERVYNMTVEDEHVYHVGYLNLLTHNNGCDDVILFRAPNKKQMNPDEEVINGFSANDHPGNGPYFASARELAEQYQYHYRNGLQQITIPKSAFDDLKARGIIVEDTHPGYEGISWHVPANKLDEFNKVIRDGKYYPE